MTVALDISKIPQDRLVRHQARGSGYYIEHLFSSLKKYYLDDQFLILTAGKSPVRADIAHYPCFEPFFLSLPVFNKQRLSVVTVHDLIPLVFPAFFPVGIKGNLRWQIQKRLLKRVGIIITDSQASKKDIVRIVGVNEDKVRVIYLAAGEKFIRIKNPACRLPAGKAGQAGQESRIKEIKKKHNIPEKFVLYAGDATWNKNLPRLVEAVKKIKVTLVMVGKALTSDSVDKDHPWNKDLVEVGKFTADDKRFIKLGYVSTEDLVKLYNAATALIMPSLYEGFGLPILEAMSCGCPVITSKRGSLPEVAGEAAYYVDPEDVKSIANGIGEVFFNNKLRQTLSEKGLKQARKFSWKRTASETLAVYKGLLKL